MAPPQLPNLTEHAAALQSILASLGVLTVAQTVDVFNTYSSAPGFTGILRSAVPEIVGQHAQAAATVTAQWYDELAPDSGFHAEPVVDLAPERIRKSIDWAIFSPGEATPLDRLAGSAKRMVYDASRDTVVQNARTEGVKFARYASATACAFCRLMATRGEVFNSEKSATEVVGRRGSRKVGQSWHDHCRCVAVRVPAGQTYTPPDYVGEWQQQYEDARDAGNGDTKSILAYMRANEKQPERPPVTSPGGGRPPGPPGPPAPPAAASDDPADRLTGMFARQQRAATEGQKAAALRWQGKDRYYEHVQQAVSDPNADPEARQVANDLADVAQPLTEDVQVWRGIRSIDAAFGSPAVGREEIVQRFTSTSIYAEVAGQEFTNPGKNPAILKVQAKAGVLAVWLPPIGNPETAYQGELLFLPGIRMRILTVDTSGVIPIIEVEVSQP